MGVDLSTYRSRIGGFKHNSGTDVISLDIIVSFNDAAIWTCVYAVFTMLVAIIVFYKNAQHDETYTSKPIVTIKTGLVLYGAILLLSGLSLKTITQRLKCIGSVAFIGMLLFLAGIEPNSGPGHGPKYGQQADSKKVIS